MSVPSIVYLQVQATSKHWQWCGFAGAATEDRGSAADETSCSANRHCKCCVVSGDRPEFFCDRDHLGGRWGTWNITTKDY